MNPTKRNDPGSEYEQESQANHLVSGDRHLLQMKKFGETRIMTSKYFLEMLVKAGGV